MVKGVYQFFYRLTIIYAFQDRQTEGLTQLVLVRQLHYLEWHEASPSDILASVFLEYVRFETPLPFYLSGIARLGYATARCGWHGRRL